MAAEGFFCGRVAALAIREETEGDAAPREALLDAAMGPIRFQRASERLREGRLPALALVALGGVGVVGTVRLWDVRANGLAHGLMLGPLAVDAGVRGLGIGAALVWAALAQAAIRGHEAVVLVGDEAYYRSFGFRARSARRLSMPGSFERQRLLGMPLAPGALDRAHGILRPAGAFAAPVRPTGFTPAAVAA